MGILSEREVLIKRCGKSLLWTKSKVVPKNNNARPSTAIKPCWPSTVLVAVYDPGPAPFSFLARSVNDSAHVRKRWLELCSGKYCYFLSFLGDERQSDAEKSPGRKREHDALKNFKGNSILNVLHSLYYFLLGHTNQ